MPFQGITFDMVKKMTAVEKDRLLAILVNTENAKVDWNQAATDLGSASANSMRTLVASTRKKYADVSKDAGEASGATPTKKPQTPRKRKIKADVDDAESNGSPKSANKKVESNDEGAKVKLEVFDAESEE